jgi:hypothetical protein
VAVLAVVADMALLTMRTRAAVPQSLLSQ